MTNTPHLSIIFGYRNRDLTLVRRCLDSLSAQTFQQIEVIFVDYGSTTATATEAARLLASYPFGRYVYSETRGLPWNRGHALNTGAHQARGQYIMTTDVDMIYPPDFLEIVAKIASPQSVLYCAPYYLPKRFDDWDHTDTYKSKFRQGNHSQKGGCQVIAREIYLNLRGFDEYYQYWGLEDHDFYHRLMFYGLKEVWLNNHTALYHQWHPSPHYLLAHGMPEGYWGRACLHQYRNAANPLRNPAGWGALKTADQRPSLLHVDFNASTVLDSPQLHWLSLAPYSNLSLGPLARELCNLPSGHALAVNNAFYPRSYPLLFHSFRAINKLLRSAGSDSQFDFLPNRVHALIAELIGSDFDLISDYYLCFPYRNGTSILVKK
jgi:glycosyltransferase involved in cell wall biosynthesis